MNDKMKNNGLGAVPEIYSAICISFNEENKNNKELIESILEKVLFIAAPYCLSFMPN